VPPLLVLGGAVLFGLGAGGLGGVDSSLQAAVQKPVQEQPQPPPPFDRRRDVGGDHARPHREEF
jgi:hypothetical protein